MIDSPSVAKQPGYRARRGSDGAAAEARRVHLLAAEYSSTLVGLDPAVAIEMENRVARALQDLGDALDADGTALLQLRGDVVERTRTWCRPGQGPQDGAGSRRVSWATAVLAKESDAAA